LLAIIQSRYNSTRLPGKVLFPLCDSSILGKCVERVSKASLVNEILIATSTENTDLPIAKYCKSKNFSYYLGPLNDVGLRLANAAASKNQDKFIRICGDSPFIDPAIIDQAVYLSTTSDFDLVTNVFPRSFPKGQSVEVIRTKTIQQICCKNRSAEEKEHATSYIYNNHTQFRICAFSSGKNAANSRQCIDDEKDYSIAKKIIALNDANDLGWREIQNLWNDERN
jgi:spore coat polysaccharide biosynthesis protein SpsF